MEDEHPRGEIEADPEPLEKAEANNPHDGGRRIQQVMKDR
jgi:hypothetical protein